MLLLKSPDATAALQHLALKRGNRRSTRTTSPNVQTAPLQPSHQQRMHQTRVLPAEGLRAIHSSTPHRISSTSHIHSPARCRRPRRLHRALQPKKLQRKHLHPLLLDFHRGHHARETHGRVPSRDRAHRPDRITVSALRRTLTATLVAVPMDVTYFAAHMACQPLGRLLFFLAHP